ncbi:MAG: glycosyltransferase family 4 protein [Gemmataceae bacterium]|nr:glycosyltransferase family 4 protein [Gemmataceae bacterium]MCI0741678.1 glycosyltransferase family 4 protein [Gemmataceae bacterium]
MNIAFCYESVLPARGGCETYISDLARRLVADGHEVHLYACRWDESALPAQMQFHQLPSVRGPRFLKPWRFSRLCREALAGARHDVSIGFDKTFGLDVLYPQGGLHLASAEHNLRKFRSPIARGCARLAKALDIAHWSFRAIERRQYVTGAPAAIIVNSRMVRDHFRQYWNIGPERLHVVHSAIDPGRFPERDRPSRRHEFRELWGIRPDECVGLLAAMNYRLKGLDPLLHALARLITLFAFRQNPSSVRLVVAGNPKFHKYQRLARRLGIDNHVHFTGHCGQMRNAYFAADFLVHPTFYDPCSLVVLEALACGLPVITTRYNGACELFTDGKEGLVIADPHDHEQLAGCLEQMLDKRRRQAMSQAARQAAERWTFEDHYRKLLQVLQTVVVRKQAA